MMFEIASRSTMRGLGPNSGEDEVFQLAVHAAEAIADDELLEVLIAELLDDRAGNPQQLRRAHAGKPRLDIDALRVSSRRPRRRRCGNRRANATVRPVRRDLRRSARVCPVCRGGLACSAVSASVVVASII